MIPQLSAKARQAVGARNWPVVNHCAAQILAIDPSSAEGLFLKGLCEKASRDAGAAQKYFAASLESDPNRFDAAVELAELSWFSGNYARAKALLESVTEQMSGSPKYLFQAAETYSKLGLHTQAWPLYVAADTAQPNVDALRGSLAACATRVGELELAKTVYQSLLGKNPSHQRNHYELARLESATDDAHVCEMQALLKSGSADPTKNIFLNYALGKELEDLQRWEEAFAHYKAGGDAAATQCVAAGYQVDSDIRLIDAIIETCDKEWISTASKSVETADRGNPIFVVGLPRTGTTLTEKIVSSHSQVESADESFFLQMAIQRSAQQKGVAISNDVTVDTIQVAARSEINDVAHAYLDSIEYRLVGKTYFVEKYPFNFLYLGFIAKALPNAKIVVLERNPMDACFSMYKQPFFKYSYQLQDLARYYQAYDRLMHHWSEVLDSLYVVQYETLVTQPESEIRKLLDYLKLDFEQACVDFHLNSSSSATASAAQIRQKAHSGSVDKWKRFENQLDLLSGALMSAGIKIH